jgi:predicted 3-demethylubiquinone-9 3-methyltransferase (glyoxalase superfamily)
MAITFIFCCNVTLFGIVFNVFIHFFTWIMQQKITPFLWFDHNAEEAINHYLSIFKNAKVLSMNRYGPGAPMPAGTLLTATLQIEGQEFVLLNGGPHYTFSPAISFVINCTNQEEVDYYWNALKEGGEE